MTNERIQSDQYSIAAHSLPLWKQYSRMVSQLQAAVPLGLRLFQRDFSAQHKQSVLGMFWVVIIPIFSVGLFWLMQNSGVLHVGSLNVPYVVYAFFGITVWAYFSGLINRVSGSVIQSAQFISTINFPRIALVFGPVLTASVDFVIRLVMLAGLVFIVGIEVHTDVYSLLLAMICMLPLVLLAVGIGLFLSVFRALIRDVGTLLGYGLNFLMFVSPVIYPLNDRDGLLGTLASINPITYLLEVPRGLLFGQTSLPWTTFLLASLFSLLVFIESWRFFQLSVGKIVERV